MALYILLNLAGLAVRVKVLSKGGNLFGVRWCQWWKWEWSPKCCLYTWACKVSKESHPQNLHLNSPFSVMVDASSYTFKYYKGGIYCNSGCSRTTLNQAMLVVGYGFDSSAGEDYWILKNRSLMHCTVVLHSNLIFLSIAGGHLGVKMATWGLHGIETILVELLHWPITP